jgi:hypothetical protein
MANKANIGSAWIGLAACVWACGGGGSAPDAAEAGDGDDVAGESAADGDEGAAEGDATAAPDTAALRAALEAAGYDVRDGVFAFPALDCCSLPTCFGNNPSSPYGSYRLPRGPGQTAPNPYEDVDGTALSWRLRGDEAIVFVGRTPPRAAYFGWTGYLFDRFAGASLPRDIRFASLGDTINVATIGTAGTPAGGPGDPFAQWTVVVMTADATADGDVRTAARGAGFDDGWLNTITIPAAHVTLGLEDEADTFNVLVRVALFDDPLAREAYLADPGGTVWRVSPRTTRAVVPLPEPALRTRGTGTAEDPALATALDELRAAILAAHPGLGVWEPPVTDVGPTPGECLTGTRNCNGDNNDTVYLSSAGFRLGDTDQDELVVYGVNHEATGKATYSNFALYEVRRLFGVASVDSRRFAGSAADYLPAHPLADRLYAWSVKRSCGGDEHCIELPATCPGLPLDEVGVVAFRAYLEPPTDTGPAGTELIPDRVIRFQP